MPVAKGETGIMPRLNIQHVTTYRYARPVGFGEHRLMLRPRDSHDIRLVSSRLSISPRAQLRWLHDVFGNSIAVARFDERSDELRFESEITIDHYGVNDLTFPLEDYARILPFAYDPVELPDLRPAMLFHAVPGQHLRKWAHQFLLRDSPSETMDVLARMTTHIRERFVYIRRDEQGVQTPEDTLRLGSGTCRDFAVLMMDAARVFGLAARFVTGYLYDPALDDASQESAIGAGATHAWCQIYLPGMGWTEFDPTNGSYSGTYLIRIGVARVPDQAVPVRGTFVGNAGGPVEMEVDVRVTRTDGS